MASLHPLPFLLLVFITICRPTHLLTLSTVDLTALSSIKSSLTDLRGSSFFSTWNFSAPDPCSSFTGVICSLCPPRVTSLSLGPSLAGTLSPAITLLSELTQLILAPGLVTGPIPPLNGLSNLRVLSLSHNRITGEIPAGISNLSLLHTVDLSFNQLTERIPPNLTKLTQLKVLVLAGNQLSGEWPLLPGELIHVDFRSNKLTGTLPLNLPASVRYLSVSGNRMWGPVSDVVGPLLNLEYLDLSSNSFSGALPGSLFRPTLSSLLLQRNNFSGRILAPVEGKYRMTPYGEGSVVDLSHNALAGELPEILASVETLFLNNNRFSGAVSEEYVRSVVEGRAKTLYLQHNFLDRFPVEKKVGLPETVAVCLAYNCMVPPLGLAGCPASTGDQLSRPAEQCSVFRNG